MYAIRAPVLFDGQKRLKDMYIIVSDSKIAEVTKEKPDVEILFEGIVTPAFIDGHSHIGMVRHSEPSSEEEVNEQADIFLPDLNPLDSVYFDDKYFEDAVEFGVLYSCILPGSGNLFGGKAIVIRNYARNRLDAPIKDIGYKMALGYNPRSTYKLWKGKRFHTRMGVYALFHRRIHAVVKKKKKNEWKIWKAKKKLLHELRSEKITKEEYEEEIKRLEETLEAEFSPVDKAILEVLEGKKIVRVHVHKEDDIVFLVNLVRAYGMRATADHTCDVYRVEGFRLLKDNNIPIMYGPIDSLAYKTELKHDSYKNVKALIDSQAKFALISDHPVVLARNLHLQLRYFIMFGYSEEKAISLITKEPAEILGINDILGTIEPGKWASLIVWDKSPFYLGARPKAVIGEGRVLFKKEE